ncbi:MAG TPA: threonine synthase [Spirochaetia bacterium]|nr:threonine synthase [Spirochaetia bacterium]
MAWPGIIEAYRKFLPVSVGTPALTLNEGDTPLIKAVNLGDILPVDLYFKFEGTNPTGSFKDRGMVLAVAKALEEGSRAVMCASTGNTAAAAAAYAARAGISCTVLLPEGKIALGKLAQALIYGARVVAVDGNFDQALDLVREMTRRHAITLVNSINPYRLEGQKTGAFEVVDQLGSVPDYLALPVGNAGNITAYWRGFREYREHGVSASVPRMLGFQAAGAAPIVLGRVVEQPETVATAIRIGNPASWQGAAAAVKESEGLIEAVTDQEILAAYQLLASREGVFCEPASAASVAGVLKLAKRGFFQPGQRVVCILTGHGLKDPDTAVKNVAAIPVRIKADVEAMEALLSGNG